MEETPEAVVKKLVARFVKYGLIGFVLLIALFGSGFTVDAGERGVVYSMFGGVKEMSYGEGWHPKIPIVQRAEIIPVKTQLYSVDAASSSQDIQDVHTTVGINYHVDKERAWLLYREVGEDYVTIAIAPAVQEVVKATTAKYKAEALIQDRHAVRDKLEEDLKARLEPYYIYVDSVSITNFAFSQEFSDEIERAAVQKKRLETETARLAVVQTEAQQKIEAAKGDAEAKVIDAQAKAQAIRVEAEALAQNKELIGLRWIEKWNGQLPTTVLGSDTQVLMSMNNGA